MCGSFHGRVREHRSHSDTTALPSLANFRASGGTRHVVESLALNAGLCVHLELVCGRDPHHIAEAQYKAIARALRAAVEPDPRFAGVVPSTKGTL